MSGWDQFPTVADDNNAPATVAPDDWSKFPEASGGRSSNGAIDYGTALQYGIANAVPFSHDIGAAVQAGETYLPKSVWGIPIPKPDDTGPDVAPGTPFSERMASQKARIEATDQAVREQYPKTSFVAPVATSIAALPFAGPADAISAGVGRVAPGLAGAATDTLASGVVGSGYGALYGAGEGDTASDRLKNAETGALWGFGGGAVAPHLADAASGALDYAAQAVVPTSTLAARKIASAIGTDVKNGNTAVSPTQHLVGQAEGQPLVVGDLGGKATGNLARAAANASPEADSALSSLVHDRFQSQGDRISDFVQGLYNQPLDATSIQDAAKARAAAVNAPLYAQAYQAGSQGVWTPRLQALTQPAEMQKAIAGAGNKSKLDAAITGNGPVANPFTFDQNGVMQLQPGQTPTLQFWDHVKRGLDDQIEAAQGGQQRSYAGQLTNLKNALLSELDSAVPSYATARATAKGAFDSDNAFEQGTEFFNKVGSPVKSSQQIKQISQMTPAQRDMFELGGASALVQKTQAAGNNRDATTLFNSPDVQSKLGLVFQNRAPQIADFIKREQGMNWLRNATIGGSNTTRQASDLNKHGVISLEGMKQAIGTPLAGAVTGGAYAAHEHGFDPLAIGKGAVYGAAVGAGAKFLAGRNEKLMQAVGEGLASPDTARVNSALARAGSGSGRLLPGQPVQKALSYFAAPGQNQSDNQPLAIPAYAKGGSVKKPSHEFLVNRLMNMVERAKKAEKERTKPLLKVPDDTVANALAAAQRAI